MAILDVEKGEVVVRVVYDGPALAGKTTSVRSLGRSLGRPVFSGEEAEGRTLHLDWLDYVGGRFEGSSIRCQVVAVPGQPALASRRQRLLETADAVVFVADSRRGFLGDGLRSLEELREFLRRSPSPSPGVVLQANKRDATDAAPLEDVRSLLKLGPTVGVTESVALDGTGVRETFVLAVRLALELVRERLQRKTLASGPPELTDGPGVLAALLAAEAAAERSMPAPMARVPVPEPSAPEAAPSAAPRPPDAGVAMGLVWPPIEGRLVLHEANAMGLQAVRLRNGDWWAVGGNTWKCHSAAGAEFPGLDAGREALIEWARWHAHLARALSPRRCLALSPAPGWRLWQVARREPSARDLVLEALASPDADVAAAGLLRAASVVLEAEARLLPLGLPVTAASVGLLEAVGVCYVGLAPRAPVPAPSSAASPQERLRGHLAPVIAKAPVAPGLSVPRLLERLRARGAGSAAADLVETLQALLIGH